jgi:DNA-binding CsgD family transcriptional regulator
MRDLPYTLCGLAADQPTTSKLLEEHHPDLLLIEPFFGNRDGIFFVKELALVAVHRLIENPASFRHASNLTDRELHVFGLIGAGFGTSRIAKELGISPRTVETYREHIKLKLGYPDADALHRGAREWFGLHHR